MSSPLITVMEILESDNYDEILLTVKKDLNEELESRGGKAVECDSKRWHVTPPSKSINPHGKPIDVYSVVLGVTARAKNPKEAP